MCVNTFMLFIIIHVGYKIISNWFCRAKDWYFHQIKRNDTKLNVSHSSNNVIHVILGKRYRFHGKRGFIDQEIDRPINSNIYSFTLCDIFPVQYINLTHSVICLKNCQFDVKPFLFNHSIILTNCFQFYKTFY